MSLCVNTLLSYYPTKFLSHGGQHNFNVASVLHMHESKFLLYLKSIAFQYLLSNKNVSVQSTSIQDVIAVTYRMLWNDNFQLQ